MQTHLIVCRNEEAIKCLFGMSEDLFKKARMGEPVSKYWALEASKYLCNKGLIWGIDFEIKKKDY